MPRRLERATRTRLGLRLGRAFAVGTGADRSALASGCRSVGEPPSATVGSRPGDAVTLITLLVVALVVVLALVYNRRVWRPRPAAVRMPGDGLGVGELMAPLASLAVILLVFVLVQTFASWAAAGTAETDEATATLLLFREADLVADARVAAGFASRSSAMRAA